VIKPKDKAEIDRITGHVFADKILLERALTHSSAENQALGDYERLEFLGDRVLGLAIAELLCRLYPKVPEGVLSARLNMLVNAEICADIAVKTGLAAYIVMSADMRKSAPRRLVNVYADVMESLIAALYLEGGLEAAQQFILRYWEEPARQSANARRDAKTELQEWSQRQKAGSLPAYRVIRRRGPDHDPVFEMEVRISGFAPAAGKGRSKRQAEQAAAEQILLREGVWTEDIEEQKQRQSGKQEL